MKKTMLPAAALMAVLIPIAVAQDGRPMSRPFCETWELLQPSPPKNPDSLFRSE